MQDKVNQDKNTPDYQIEAAPAEVAVEGLTPLPGTAGNTKLSRTKSETLLSKQLPGNRQNYLLRNQSRAGNHEVAKQIERLKIRRLTANSAEVSASPNKSAEHAVDDSPSSPTPATQLEPTKPAAAEAQPAPQKLAGSLPLPPQNKLAEKNPNEKEPEQKEAPKNSVPLKPVAPTPPPMAVSTTQKAKNKKNQEETVAPVLNAPATPVQAPPEKPTPTAQKVQTAIAPNESAETGGETILNNLKENPASAEKAEETANNDLKELTPDESNAELAALPQPVVQRAKIEIAEPPLPAPTPAPQKHPGFAGATSQLKQTAEQEKQHEPTAEKQGDILESADPPDNETETLAESNQVGKMDEAPTGEFDKNAFVKKMTDAAANIAPKDENELKDFPNSGKAQGLKNEAKNEVKNSQENAQKDLQKTSNETPNQSEVTAKTVNPLNPEKPGDQPQVGATQAVPDAKPASATDLSYGPKAIEQKMQETDPVITEDVMKKVPDPKINDAVAQKEDLDKKVEQAPVQFRQQEQAIRSNTQTDIQASVTQGVTDIHDQRTQDFGEVSEEQTTSKGKDDVKYQQVMTKLNEIYTTAKDKVDGILKALPDKVNALFDSRADAAAQKMNKSIQAEIDQLKSDRRDVTKQNLWDAGVNLVGDTFKGVPKELVEPIYSRGKDKYLADMKDIAALIANIIDGELKLAKNAIAEGKQQVQNHLKTLPEDLQEIGEQAADEINSRFDELSDSVSEAAQELENNMADKFREAGQKADAMLKELREKNKGFLDKVASAIGDALSVLGEIKDKILALFNKAKNVFLKIIQDPFAFAGNLINAGIKGLQLFIKNLPNHLKQGMITWLGKILGGTIELPANFDFQGILSIGLQVMGITVQNVKDRAKKIVGAEAMEQFEQTVDFIKSLGSGVGNIIGFIKEHLDQGNIISTVFDGIKDWVIQKVVTMAVTKIVTMFVPGGGLLQIIDTVIKFGQFLIENASDLIDFANSILDSVEAIANGNTDEAARKVETTLANALPLAISMLAKLLNLDGIGKTIKGIIEKIRTPVNKAIDFVVGKVANQFKTAMRQLKKAIETIKRQAKSAMDKGKRQLTTTTNKIKTTLGKGEQKLTSKFARVKQETAKGDQELTQYPNKVKAEVTKGQQALNELSALPEGAQEAAKYKKELSQLQSDATKKAGSEKQTLAKIKTQANTDANTAKTALKQHKNLATSTKQQATQKLTPFGNAFGAIKNVLKGGLQAAKNVFNSVQTAVTGARQLVDKALAKAKEAISKAQSKIQSITSKIRSGITALKNKIKAGISALKGKIQQFVQRVKASVKKVKDLFAAIKAGTGYLKQKDKSAADTRKALPTIATKYPGIKLSLVTEKETETEGFYHIDGKIQRQGEEKVTVSKSKKANPDTTKTKIKLHRPGWSEDTKKTLHITYAGLHKQTKDNSIKLKAGQARRHIVSCQTMKEHFETTLNNLTLTKSKELLKSRDSSIKVEATNSSIQGAAQARLSKFFNDVDNLMVGDQSSNSKIQEMLDEPQNWSERKLKAHIKTMLTKYGLHLEKDLIPKVSELRKRYTYDNWGKG